MDEKGRSIRFAVAAIALIMVAGCATTRPVGEQFDDAAITTKIEAKLAADPDVSAFNVDVDTNQGVVRLSGTVEDREARAIAERLARETKGVSRVINQIEVGERSLGDRLSDTAITAKVKAKITGDPELNPFNISVDTKDGVVTLRGIVTSRDRREEAEKLARNTDGVQRVQNLLEIEGN